MSDCCDPIGYRKVFDTKEAKRAADKFARKGADSTAGPMIEVVDRLGLEGRTVLEVGGGSSWALAELLKRGAATGTSIDLSAAYEPVAAEVLAAAGVADRATVRVGDFVAEADEMDPADIVFANRVVCCYPDAAAMVRAVTSRAARVVALSFPRNRAGTRFFVRMGNWWLRRRKVGFQVFVHDPGEIAAGVAAAGFRPVEAGTTFIWHWQVWARP